MPLLVIFGAALAFFTWRAQASGEMAVKFNMLRRADYPRIFQAGLIMRVGLVIFAFALALAAAFRWI